MKEHEMGPLQATTCRSDLMSEELKAAIQRNGWHVVLDQAPGQVDRNKAPDDEYVADRLLTVRRREDEVVTRILLGEPTFGLVGMAADLRDVLSKEEAAQLLICAYEEHEAHTAWIETHKVYFVLRYVREAGVSEAAFWDSVLFPAVPAQEPVKEVPQVVPEQDPEDRVVLLTGWAKSKLCAEARKLAPAVAVLDGDLDGLDYRDAGYKLRRLAHYCSQSGAPLVMSIRDDSRCAYACRLFRAHGIRVGMYNVVPTRDGLKATRI